MDQWEKVPGTKRDDLSWVSEIHKVERENWYLQDVPGVPHTTPPISLFFSSCLTTHNEKKEL